MGYDEGIGTFKGYNYEDNRNQTVTQKVKVGRFGVGPILGLSAKLSNSFALSSSFQTNLGGAWARNDLPTPQLTHSEGVYHRKYSGFIAVDFRLSYLIHK